jgi:hypothetical protein
MRRKKNKGPLRNFNFLKEADDELLRRAEGIDMVVVLEDLLLDRRQFSRSIEDFIATEIKRTGRPRREIIEAALFSSKQTAVMEKIATENIHQVMPKPNESAPKTRRPRIALQASSPKRSVALG